MLSHFRLSDLNPQQKEAVTTIDGPLLVLAGAGSGKTRVITYRIAYLLSQGVPASSILAVSFTNKAAEEMKERIERMIGGKAAHALTLSTFHSLGLLILKAECEALGFPRGFTVYDTSDQLGVIREILKEAQVADRRLDVKSILFRISRLKNAGISPEKFIKQMGRSAFVSEYDGFAAEVYPRYQEKLKAFHALDFDDLLVETKRLFIENESVLQRWQKKFRYILVDEYQDTNHCQLELLQMLSKLHGNLAVVGDDDQSIYSWRGAVSENILTFHQQFPGSKVIKLEENYRSTQVILDAANSVIAKNQKRQQKTLWSQKKQGDLIQMVVCPDAEAEAEFIAGEIEFLRSYRKKELRDIAILYRSNIQARSLEESLRQNRIDYKMIGGQAFFDRKEVKDCIAYLKLLIHPRDEISLRRIINYPARGIGAATLEAASHLQKQIQIKDSQTSLWDSLLVISKNSSLQGGDLLNSVHSLGPPLSEASVANPELNTLPSSVGSAKLAAAGSAKLSTSGKNSLCQFVDLMQRHRALFLEGQGFAKKAKAFLEEVGLFDELIRSGPTATAAQKRIRNVEGFLESLERYEQKSGMRGTDQLSAYLQKLSLQTQDDDAEDALTNEITLSTLHGAKGLEFQVVFLVGVEEELLPHKRTLYPSEMDLSEVAGPTDISEERRLFYVGITRARELLYLSQAQNRGTRGIPRVPSRFLEDIPAHLVKTRKLEDFSPSLSKEEEEAFVKAQLEKLKQLTS